MLSVHCLELISSIAGGGIHQAVPIRNIVPITKFNWDKNLAQVLIPVKLCNDVCQTTCIVISTRLSRIVT